MEREKDKLAKQQAELQIFDEKLRHYADQRINLDLDDGVKVNYGKFGNLLTDVKAVTGSGVCQTDSKLTFQGEPKLRKKIRDRIPLYARWK